MPYGFNDDKSKSNISDDYYTKAEIDAMTPKYYVVQGSLSVPANTTSLVKYTAAQLAEQFGITDSILNYAVVSAMYANNATNTSWKTSYGTPISTTSYMSPITVTEEPHDGSLIIQLHNETTSARTEAYRIVFVKLSTN